MITISHTSNKEPVPPLVRIREVAQLLSVSRHTVHSLIESGDLAASQINASAKKERLHVRITRSSLLKFYKKRFGHSLNQALANPFDS